MSVIIEQSLLAACSQVSDLNVNVDTLSFEELLSGTVRSITIDASLMRFQDLSFSKGARLRADSIQFDVPKFAWSDLFSNPLAILSSDFRQQIRKRLLTPPKLAKPCSLSFTVTMTDSDLSISAPVREALAEVVQSILNRSVLALNPFQPIIGMLTPFFPKLAQAIPDLRGSQVVVKNVRSSAGLLRIGSEVKPSNSSRFIPLEVTCKVAVGQNGRMIGILQPMAVLSFDGNEFPVPFGAISLLGIDLGPDVRLVEIALLDGAVTTSGQILIRPERVAVTAADQTPPTLPKRRRLVSRTDRLNENTPK